MFESSVDVRSHVMIAIIPSAPRSRLCIHVQVVEWDRLGGLLPLKAQAALITRPEHAAIVADVVSTLDANRSAAGHARVMSSVSRLAAALTRTPPTTSIDGPAAVAPAVVQLARAATAAGGIFESIGAGASDVRIAAALNEAAAAPGAAENPQLTALANAATIAQCAPTLLQWYSKSDQDDCSFVLGC